MNLTNLKRLFSQTTVKLPYQPINIKMVASINSLTIPNFRIITRQTDKSGA
ncbi:hypothetical protein QUW12_06155 [Limosilactobacillus vaginalis]|nr:hypothetical protein [Limosilactobacillus vaginalis]